MSSTAQLETETTVPTAEPRPRAAWLENRETQFWILQLIGWSGWAVAGIVAWAYWDAHPVYNVLFPLAAVGGIAVSTGLRYLYRSVWNATLFFRAATLIVASYVAAGLWQMWKNWLLYNLAPELASAHGLSSYFEGILSSFYIVLCWSGLYFGVKYYQMLQAESQKLLQVSAMAHQAQLKMLRYQLNPHFLFNTLNAISTLILDRRTDLANTMVSRLSSFLRYSLDSDPMAKVELDDEINALRLYLDIEQVRFDDRLKIDIDLDEQARHALIPSLLLQPLVENAVKYAIAPSELGGTIHIKARVFAGELLLELSDTGPGMADLADLERRPGHGVGLQNTRERLRSLYGEAQSFRLAQAEPQGLKVCMRMPYETR